MINIINGTPIYKRYFWIEQYTKRSAKQNSYDEDILQHNKGYIAINTM